MKPRRVLEGARADAVQAVALAAARRPVEPLLP